MLRGDAREREKYDEDENYDDVYGRIYIRTERA